MAVTAVLAAAAAAGAGVIGCGGVTGLAVCWPGGTGRAELGGVRCLWTTRGAGLGGFVVGAGAVTVSLVSAGLWACNSFKRCRMASRTLGSTVEEGGAGVAVAAASGTGTAAGGVGFDSGAGAAVAGALAGALVPALISFSLSSRALRALA